VRFAVCGGGVCGPSVASCSAGDSFARTISGFNGISPVQSFESQK